MEIFLNILFLILGLFMLIKGADYFVGGASAFAKRLKVPTMVIGLTVVAIGTSLPELAVSISSAIKGVTDMSIGNIVGSNLFNMFVCLGIVAIINPITMKSSTKKIDFPFLVALTTMLVIFSVDKYLDGLNYSFLSRTESILLLTMLALYLYVTVSNARKDRKKIIQDSVIDNSNNINKEEDGAIKDLKGWQIAVYLIVGLLGVVFGGEFVSSTAQFLAIKIGMSEALVGLTIVAVGTSLPELVTSIVAAKKGENDLALGNVIGSNVMNIAMILGTVGIITQINITTSMLIDLGIMLAGTILFIVLCLTKNELRRKEGYLFVILYVIDIIIAIIRNYCL